MGSYHLQYLSLLMTNCSKHKQQGELVQIVAQPSCAPAIAENDRADAVLCWPCCLGNDRQAA